jgi:GT2 family glycosyltransferase
MLGQKFGEWEWVLAVADLEGPAAGLIREHAAADTRIRLVTGAGVAGLEAAYRESTAEWVTFLGDQDVLVPKALGYVEAKLRTAERLDILYTDEDVLLADGERVERYLKPDWSPERLRHQPYVGDLVVLRRSAVESAGGIVVGAGDAARYDLILRVSEVARDVHHMQRLLYSKRDRQRVLTEADAAAVSRHLDRLGIAGTATVGEVEGTISVNREPDLTTTVSVVIPTIGTSGDIWGERRTMVTELVRHLVENDSHPHVEYVIVYDPPTPPEVLDDLRALDGQGGASIRLVLFEQPFSFSAKCNVGAYHATGDVVIFLNDDMEPRGKDTIGQLIAPLREPGVGMTGAKLYFEDGRIQHGGVIYGNGHINDRHRLADPDSTGERGELFINREQSALTGACVAVRRELFEEVGGFSELLPVNFNDVDFSLKVRRAGYRLLWLHGVRLWHFESVSRDTTVHAWEVELMIRRWGDFHVVPERYTTGIR